MSDTPVTDKVKKPKDEKSKKKGKGKKHKKSKKAGKGTTPVAATSAVANAGSADEVITPPPSDETAAAPSDTAEPSSRLEGPPSDVE